MYFAVHVHMCRQLTKHHDIKVQIHLIVFIINTERMNTRMLRSSDNIVKVKWHCSFQIVPSTLKSSSMKANSSEPCIIK